MPVDRQALGTAIQNVNDALRDTTAAITCAPKTDTPRAECCRVRATALTLTRCRGSPLRR